MLRTDLTPQSWQTTACQKGGYLQQVESTNTVRKSALTNDKPEMCLQPLIWSTHQYIQGETEGVRDQTYTLGFHQPHPRLQFEKGISEGKYLENEHFYF